MIDPLYTSAFLMGLIGSGHCIAMCGGIASSLQLASDKRKTFTYSLAYNIGRALSYMIAGALVAGISSQFAKQNTSFSLILSFIAAIFMLLVGVYIMRLGPTLQWLEKIGKTLIWQHIVKLNKYLMPINSPFKALGYGALWGWLPCGLVYSALTWAMTSPSALDGALVMLCFALGTFPAMITLGVTAQKLNTLINHPWTRIVLGSVIIWYGIYLLIIATDKLVL
ncbi:sulfite exporter TauE/SafE family protein [Pseudoalteromonas sp. SG45-5]|uniref:Cytochrome biogenesis protein n=1 Tax=Pseudoalteromonas aliena TaxID=247523 RepID=A0A1Q2H2T4_9GAMM|nr:MULTISPECIES: sulfite exporter TauE/SafE family protein [Pseudoalteromonas]AQQ01675.1 cytochrome biogenesis protein [Pseudoalteromonas aliena]MBB1384857.1 sulfite exporter TauE/SafE family protein [Pseudoalteromonas sp. SG45-5]MBB1392747.1 sulfite exporter TauE/SafE family protein [Pseudoalteromonas sp. SG44-4]MBB1445673.1 sulfite exporter TauE/SafE family protein [Pseudoalteromonas sp. SG41-6]